MALLEATHGLKENGGGGGEKDPHYLKICHACSTIMKLGTVIPYLKKIKKKKYLNCLTLSLCVLLASAFFHRKSANFAISRNTDIDCISIHNF